MLLNTASYSHAAQHACIILSCCSTLHHTLMLLNMHASYSHAAQHACRRQHRHNGDGWLLLAPCMLLRQEHKAHSHATAAGVLVSTCGACVYVCVQVCVHVCRCICVYVCVHLCMFTVSTKFVQMVLVSTCVCMCVSMCVCAGVCTRVQVHLCICVCTSVHLCMYTVSTKFVQVVTYCHIVPFNRVHCPLHFSAICTAQTNN